MSLTSEDLQALSNMMDEKLDQKLDEKLQPVYNRLDKLESEVSALRNGQLELKKEVREVKHRVNDTYDLALDAWGQSTENRRWMEKL